VPFLVQGGEARAGLDAIECSVASRPDRVDIQAATSAVSAKLAAVSDANMNGTPNPPTTPATVLDVNVLGIHVTATVTGNVASSLPGAGPELFEFDPPYVDPGTPQTLSATASLSRRSPPAASRSTSPTPCFSPWARWRPPWSVP
jgi:hypothetical protein